MSEKGTGEESGVVKFDPDDKVESVIANYTEVLPPEPVDPPKETEWMGVKFPAYFQGMHFVDVKGSTVMAVDPACLTMEMKANWESVYRPELAALGRQVIEKALHTKIEIL